MAQITEKNFAKLLDDLSFKKTGTIYSKSVNGALLEVDFSKKSICYPETQGMNVNSTQTCNFSENENFVVFVCVYRLLEKGYKPQHIELEPKWKVGHGASGGRADVLVSGADKKPLLIIECKTPGKEFNKYWNKTLQDGDQLFSYTQQISETQFLCMYSAEVDGSDILHKSHIIIHKDNDEFLADHPTLNSFKSASNVNERFKAWRDTYKQDFITKGIFEDNAQAYHIGKDKYSLADLQAISASDQQKKYHEFATILRQHNVSGRENAFDKLVNLFLCKLVDETENPDDLKFYWKGVAYDTHFDLVDRLQQLYQTGMGKFLDEDITYINQNDVNNALRFIRQNPDATHRAVWGLFVQQKFFTNSDFSFIDVHNERLFYQNANILLKILQMWQDIRLTSFNGHNQFLGDMFEGFLDQGIKQSEGQYFTPMPICRFIMMSLPLESIVRDYETPPKAIDYACGAGHFLNELAIQVQPLLQQHRPQSDVKDYHKSIYGIEKEYRLSKIAKVSAFMYGQQDIHICYGDALVRSHNAFPEILDNSFDLLVANPPYSVRGFLETLPDEERDAYTLTRTINDAETANSIETFFIERTKQLLKAGGVAAIIVPTSIIDTGSRTYIRTREILLQYFDIVAIAEFGSGTFGKTGTNTVTLFLRRKPTQPDTAEHYRERVNEWFKGCSASKRKQVIYKDGHLIEQYCTHISVPFDDYKSLLRSEFDGLWGQHDHFKVYHDAFTKSAELKNLKKTKKFKGLDQSNKEEIVVKQYMAYVQSVERDKLYHFIMASDQDHPVLVIRTPSGTKEIKKFLGYEWTDDKKKGQGIKLFEDANGKHITSLYDGPDHANPVQFNRGNPTKLNHYIGANFDGSLGKIPDELGGVAKTAQLVDMLDFSMAVFDKQLSLSSRNAFVVTSKWPLVRLESLAKIKKGTSITQKKATQGKYKVVAGGVDYAYMHNKSNRPANTITISASGASAGFVNFWKEEIFASDCSTVRGADDEHTEYLFNILKCRQAEIQSHAKGAAQPHVYPKDMAPILIPKADPAAQAKAVEEWRKIEDTVSKSQETLTDCSTQIEALVESTYLSGYSHTEIEKLSTSIQYGLNEKMNETGIGYKTFRMNEVVQGRMVDNGTMKYADISADEFDKYKLKRGDLLFIRSNGSLDHIGKVGLFGLDGEYCYASYLVRVVADQSKALPKYLVTIMNSLTFRKGMVRLAVKSGGTNNINATKMKGIKVPVPSLTQQKKFVFQIEILEKKIADAQAIIDNAPARKQAVMQKYL